MVHGDDRPRRRVRDFKYPDKCVFEKNFVIGGRDLYGVIAVGVLRFVLPVKIKNPRGHHKKNRD